jgi:DivIVA domain-containing protein
VDRDDIERRDFPPARKGYDPAAVDEHLRRVADEFDLVGREAAGNPRPPSLSEGASERVRAILEAAEASAQQLRDDAGRDASGHVERVEGAARGMLDKLERLQSELDRLLAGLKSTAETLSGGLQELSREVGTVRGPEAAAAAPEPASPNGAAGSDDEAGARLVAFNMALEGTSREDAARYLAAHYTLPDVELLLDQVYASAGR